MSYLLKTFRVGTTDVALPVYDPQIPVGGGPSLSGVTRVAGGGFYDAYGAGDAPMALPYPLPLRAVVTEATRALIHAQLLALRGLRGRPGLLYRELHDGALQNCAARVLEVPPQSADASTQDVEILFQVLSEWRGAAHGAGWYLDSGFYFDAGLYLDTGDAVFTLDSSPKTVTLPNAGSGGAAVHAVVITLTAGAEDITAVTIENTTTLCKFTWTGTLSTTKALVIDAGAQTVKDDGANAYAYFALDAANHKNSWWFELAPGANAVTVAITGGATDSTILFEYAEGWE